MTEDQQIPLSSMNFLDLAKTRYSVRSYDPRPIEKEKMDYVMECARMAPSAVNFQPWKFFVINTPRNAYRHQSGLSARRVDSSRPRAS